VAALLVDDYRQQNRSRKNVRNVERIVRQLREAFAGLWLRITARRVERWKADQRAAGIPPATINRRLAALRRMGRLAVRAGLVPSRPDFSLLDESDNVRQGFIDPSQFSAFTVALPTDVADATWFA